MTLQRLAQTEKNYKLTERKEDSKIRKAGLNLQLSKQEKKQELEFKKWDMDLFMDKMKEPKYATMMRQDVIAECYEQLKYNSQFTVVSTDGKDAIVESIDNLIKQQVSAAI